MTKKDQVENKELYEDMGINVDANEEIMEGEIYLNTEKIESFYSYNDKETKLITDNSFYILPYNVDEFVEILKTTKGLT